MSTRRVPIRERLARLLPDGFRGRVAAATGGHRAYVGSAEQYDIAGASQFNLLTLLGIREHHALLDIGCGSLRAGRLFLMYLQPGCYYAIEPQRWLVESALAEIGRELIRIKRPAFDHGDGFRLDVFGRTFDYLLASSVFSHAAESQIRACLSQASAVMTPESLLLASFLPGATNYDGDRWTYPGTVTYTFERMAELAEEQRLDLQQIDWPYVYGAGGQAWLAFSTRR
ncbi:MAG: class I SAM-dependent methyltransferase [Vicinamibacterales bacterium]